MDRTKNAVAIFDKHAKSYQDKYMDVGLYHRALDVFCRRVKVPHANVLELACGPGNVTKYLLGKRPDFKILGTDLAPKMLELAALNNPPASFQIMDCRDIGTLDQDFDAIVGGFCLPYLSKEEALAMIRDISKLLKAGGIVYLSTMEDDYNRSGIQWSSSGDEMYIHYHEAGYLVEALKENGLKPVYVRRQDYPVGDGTATVDLVIIAKK